MTIEKVIAVCVTVFLLAAVGSCTASNYDKREKWAEAVKNGADPMAVSCALSSSDATAEHLICYALANKR